MFTTFVNGRLCRGGELVEDQLVVSQETGKILKRAGYIGGEAVDLEDKIIAPGYLELQTNGMLGFHFTHFTDDSTYSKQLEKVARYLPRTGVTSYWATIPTVASSVYHQVLPCLQPADRTDAASLLGAHVEGPYLHASKKGAHDASLFQEATIASVEQVYGQENLERAVKLVTMAPERPGSLDAIQHLRKQYDCRISLGHSAADYQQAKEGLAAGATCVTHLFNAMNPLHHRTPGLVGLIAEPDASRRPHFSLIADHIHLHPSVLSLAYHSNPTKAILITDSIELAGLPDGTYPGHAQIPHEQSKTGNKVVIKDTDTLIGSCCGLDECVRNLMAASGCSVAQAVRCVTENIANLMGLEDRGRLEAGHRADFVIIDDAGRVLETWVAGRQVYSVN